MDEITRRLDKLCGNKNELSPYNTPAQNSSIIAQQNNQKFLNRQMNQREREIKNIPKEIVKNRRSSINFQLPQINLIKNYKFSDTPLQTPDGYWCDVAQNWVGSPDLPISGPPRSSSPPLFDYERDFPPLSKFVPQPPEPREASFLFSDGSFSPLRNKLKHIAPLPNKPIVNNFSRPITKIADDSNNSISITSKRSNLEPIGQKQLSEQLQQIFPDVDQKESETFKERTNDLDEVIEKLSRLKEDNGSSDQVTFESEFLTGGQNSKFDSFVKRFGLTNENLQFADFLQTDYCKEIIHVNDLKIHIETGNIYYNDTDTNESIFGLLQNQQNTAKGLINYDLKFHGSYKKYFNWVLNEFDAPKKK